MANLNLSEFGENTSVSDADYTFVWDSAASISKKVSRNSWLNSGTLTSSAPVTISQTWAGTGSTVFKALVVNAVSTASAAGSFLLDLQLGGVSKFSVYRDGGILLPNAATIGNAATSLAIGTTNFYPAGTSGTISTLGTVFAPFFGIWVGTGSNAAFLTSDSLNTLALRNGAAAQTFNVYGTYSTSPSLAYARLAISCDTSGNATLTTQSTGVAGTVSINGVPVGLRGQFTVAIGAGCLPVNTAIQNTGLGVNALQLNTSGNFNCAIGNNVLAGNTTGSNNIGIGSTAGNNAGITNNSVFLGTDTKALGTGQTNQIVIGYDATGIGSHSVVLGNDSIEKTALKGNVGIGTTSPTSKLHVAETWNNAGTTFCAIKSVITDTNSAAGSDFLELYSGTSTQPLRMDINKTGQINIYGTWTDASNYERLSFSAPTAGNAIIGTNKSGGSSVARGLDIITDGTSRITIASGGAVTFNFTGSATTFVTNINCLYDINPGAGRYFRYVNSTGISSPSAGVLQIEDLQAVNTTPRIQFAGTTDSFPALKRSTTRIQAVLATTDTTFTNIQGKLTTDTDYTATVVTPTGFLTLYDAQGTAYRVPCVLAT